MFIVNLLAQSKLAALYMALSWAEEPIPTYTKAINLAIFLIALFFLVRKPFTQAMDERRGAIRIELDRARLEKQAAEERLREIEGRLSRIDEEVNEIRANAEREGKAEYARLIKLAEEE